MFHLSLAAVQRLSSTESRHEEVIPHLIASALLLTYLLTASGHGDVVPKVNPWCVSSRGTREHELILGLRYRFFAQFLIAKPSIMIRTELLDQGKELGRVLLDCGALRL